MKITIVIGSPKFKESNSEIIVNSLCPMISDNDIEIININRNSISEKQFERIFVSDALIFAFPLYADSISSHLLRFLADLELKGFHNKDIMVYTIVNNGFFEGCQNHIAIAQMKNWCNAVQLKWGQGIGIGSGEMQPAIRNVPAGHGPNKSIGNALKSLADHINNCKSGKDILVSPNFPRFLWKKAGNIFWYQQAKENGLRKKDLYKKIH